MFNGLRKYILPFTLIYLISPIDLLPLIPVDDLLVAVLALAAYFITGNSNLAQNIQKTAREDEEDDVITTSWSVVEDK